MRVFDDLFGGLIEYPQIELAMACFRGTTKSIFVDSKFAKGNIFYMLDAGITFLMNNLKIGGKVVVVSHCIFGTMGDWG